MFLCLRALTWKSNSNPYLREALNHTITSSFYCKHTAVRLQKTQVKAELPCICVIQEVPLSDNIAMNLTETLQWPAAIGRITRVPTQIVFSNSCVFPVFFPVRLQTFPVPINIICDYYIHKTDFADLSSFWKKMDFFATNTQSLLLLESEHLLLELTKFLVFWQNFQIPWVFPDRDVFLPFSLFSLCRGYPVLHRVKERKPPRLSNLILFPPNPWRWRGLDNHLYQYHPCR